MSSADPLSSPIECTDDPARVDLAQLLDLYRITWWAQDRTRDQVRRALEHSRPVISAWEGKRMVGFTRVISDLTYRATIWDVIVLPSHQGRGVGTLMMHRVLEHPARILRAAGLSEGTGHGDDIPALAPGSGTRNPRGPLDGRRRTEWKA